MHIMEFAQLLCGLRMAAARRLGGRIVNRPSFLRSLIPEEGGRLPVRYALATTSPGRVSDPRGSPPGDVIQSNYGCLVAKSLIFGRFESRWFCDIKWLKASSVALQKGARLLTNSTSREWGHLVRTMVAYK